MQDTSAQPDYKKQVSDDLDNIESRAILFNDMINHKTPGDRISADMALQVLRNDVGAGAALQKFSKETAGFH